MRGYFYKELIGYKSGRAGDIERAVLLKLYFRIPQFPLQRGVGDFAAQKRPFLLYFLHILRQCGRLAFRRGGLFGGGKNGRENLRYPHDYKGRI